MSQYKFFARTKDDVPVEVMAGWDRPCGEFYLTLFFSDVLEDEEEVLWSTMRDGAKLEDKLGTLRLRNILTEYGIEPPKGFWEGVEKREGNVIQTLRIHA